MRRWVVGLGGAVVLVVATVVVALHNAGRWIEAHRDQIGTSVSDAVGRSVSFGRVGVSFLPSLGVRVEDVRVGDDLEWSAEPFVTAHAADVAVAILPALFGRIVVRRVVLDAPVVTVIRGPTGRNIDSLGRRPGPRAGADGTRGGRTGAAEGDAGKPRVAAPLTIVTGSIRNGHLRLVNRRRDGEAVAELGNVDGTITGVGSDGAASIDVRARMPGTDRRNVRLAGTVGPFDLRRLERTHIDVEVRVDAVDVARWRDAVPEFAAAIPGPLVIAGPVDGTITASGTAEAPAFDVRIDASRARVGWAAWFAKAPGVPLTMSGTGRRVGTGAHFDAFALRLAAFEATGHGDASPERIAMHLEAGPVALAPLGALLPALASRRVGGEVGIRVDATGPVTKGRTPALTGTVTLRDVSVVSEDPPFEIAGLTQTIALEGDSAVLPATSVRVNGAAVVVSGRAGRFGSPVVGLSDLDLRVFGGRVRGSVEADRTTPARPRFAAELRLDDIDVAAVAAQRAPAAARTLAGRLSGDVRVAGRGATPSARRASLVGNGRLAIEDGVLRGVNLVDRVLSGVTRVPGLAGLVPGRLRSKYPAVFGDEDTRFDELTSVWRLADGVVHLDRVAVAARDFTAEGRGTLTLDGRLVATGALHLAEGLSDDVVRATRVAGLLQNAHGRVVVPFAVEGTWPRVRVTPDVEALARTVQGGALQQGLDRLLDGLFKR